MEASTDTEMLLKREREALEMRSRTEIQRLHDDLERERDARFRADASLQKMKQTGGIIENDTGRPAQDDGALEESKRMNEILHARVLELEGRLISQKDARELLQRQQLENQGLVAAAKRQDQQIQMLSDLNKSLRQQCQEHESNSASIGETGPQPEADVLAQIKMITSVFQDEIAALRKAQCTNQVNPHQFSTLVKVPLAPCRDMLLILTAKCRRRRCLR